MKLASKSFEQGQTIPVKLTCEGENLSPELHWKEPPEKTKTFALIADDPDAPGETWVHWLLYNIPADITSLPEGISAGKISEQGIGQGYNNFKKTGYGGPCPPHGHGSHRYFFRLYALDNAPDLDESATRPELEQAMENHILAEAELMGRFERK